MLRRLVCSRPGALLPALGLAVSLSAGACASAPSAPPPAPPPSAPPPSGASAAGGNGGGAATAPASGWAETETALRAALSGAHRPPEQRARDGARHPVETLKFFGLRRDMTVVELWPGSGAWYTAVLAPVLAEKGKLVVTNFDPKDPKTAKYAKGFLAAIEKHPDVYRKIDVRVVAPPEKLDFGPAGSADLIVSFRNVHGWMNRGYVDKVLAAAFRTLKSGGVLGIVQHRAKPGSDPAKAAKTGYVPEDHVIKLAEAAGFKLMAKSEVNANPRDTKDHPEGVWTLPPTLKLKDKDRAKYVAIGESDRMTLKFVKP